MSNLKRYNPREFKAAVKAGKSDACVIFGKACTGTEVEKDGSLVFTISSGAVDRDNDTIKVDGWDFTNFKSNPVVLWGHDGSLPPIGKATSVWVEDGRVKSRVEFTPPDMNHPLGVGFGDTVRRMFQEGFLHATSVGFSPKEFSFNAERGDLAIDFSKQELLEFSAVPIPANPEALIGASLYKSAEKDLLRWCELQIDSGKDEWSIECAKALHKGLGGAKTISIPEKKTGETILAEVTEDFLSKEVGYLHDLATSISKRGRVLSAGNESKLREALSMIGAVLAQLEPEQDPEDLTDEQIAASLAVASAELKTQLRQMVGQLYNLEA